jgi:hypothetical protein
MADDLAIDDAIAAMVEESRYKALGLLADRALDRGDSGLAAGLLWLRDNKRWPEAQHRGGDGRKYYWRGSGSEWRSDNEFAWSVFDHPGTLIGGNIATRYFTSLAEALRCAALTVAHALKLGG